MPALASSFDKISPTAFMVAYARQFTDILYAKELAQLVNAQAVLEQLQEQQSDQPVEVAVLVEGRYKAMNQVMAQFTTTQILELASGLLPRGMVMSQSSNIVFLESDLPTMIKHKQQLVYQLIGTRANLYFVAIDATSQPSQFPLNVKYLDSQKPLTILCEGLLQYLTFTQKQQVFANVRELLEVHGGVWITPDLVTKQDLARRWQISPSWRKLAERVNRMTKTPETYFDDLDQVQQFVTRQGFQFETYRMGNVLNQMTCLQPLGIDSAVAKSLLADSLVFVLTLQRT